MCVTLRWRLSCEKYSPELAVHFEHLTLNSTLFLLPHKNPFINIKGYCVMKSTVCSLSYYVCFQINSFKRQGDHLLSHCPNFFVHLCLLGQCCKISFAKLRMKILGTKSLRSSILTYSFPFKLVYKTLCHYLKFPVIFFFFYSSLKQHLRIWYHCNSSDRAVTFLASLLRGKTSQITRWNKSDESCHASDSFFALTLKEFPVTNPDTNICAAGI